MNTEGELITFPPSGHEPRVVNLETSADALVSKKGTFTCTFDEMLGVENIPAFEPHVRLVVSAMVLAAVNTRGDLIAPNTGSTALRNERGHIAHVMGFKVRNGRELTV